MATIVSVVGVTVVQRFPSLIGDDGFIGVAEALGVIKSTDGMECRK